MLEDVPLDVPLDTILFRTVWSSLKMAKIGVTKFLTLALGIELTDVTILLIELVTLITAPATPLKALWIISPKTPVVPGTTFPITPRIGDAEP